MGKVIQASGVVHDRSVPLQLNGHFSAVGMQLKPYGPTGSNVKFRLGLFGFSSSSGVNSKIRMRFGPGSILCFTYLNLTQVHDYKHMYCIIHVHYIIHYAIYKVCTFSRSYWWHADTEDGNAETSPITFCGGLLLILSIYSNRYGTWRTI